METDGLKFNPYNPCVANTIIEGDPPAILFRADEVKANHKDTKLVDKFEQWIEFLHGYPLIGKVKSER